MWKNHIQSGIIRNIPADNLPAKTKRNKHVIITSKRRFDVIITYLLRCVPTIVMTSAGTVMTKYSTNVRGQIFEGLKQVYLKSHWNSEAVYLNLGSPYVRTVCKGFPGSSIRYLKLCTARVREILENRLTQNFWRLRSITIRKLLRHTDVWSLFGRNNYVIVAWRVISWEVNASFFSWDVMTWKRFPHC